MNKETKIELVITLVACFLCLTFAFYFYQFPQKSKITEIDLNTPAPVTITVAFRRNIREIWLQQIVENKVTQIPNPTLAVEIPDTPSCVPTPTPTMATTPTPTSTPTPEPTPTPMVWRPYLASSYEAEPGACGNRGEALDGKKVIAMWQSDTNYLKYKNICEPYKTFYANKDAKKYGALPYGTQVEMRVWLNGKYKYLGVYTVLDDSPTTQYCLSDVAKALWSKTERFHFDYQWESKTYFGESAPGGIKTGYIPNWKEEYNYHIQGWLDVKDADWGFVIVEIRILD